MNSKTLLILILFIGLNIARTIGIDYKLFQIIIMAFAIAIACKNKIIFHNKTIITLSIIILLFGFHAISLYGAEGSLGILLTLLTTPILLIPYNRITSKQGNIYFKILCIFFISESVFAILSTITGQIFVKLPFEAATFNTTEFRAYTFHGTSLSDALIVTTIMSFILYSPLREKYKICMWIIGFISILCFNCRAAIVMNVGLFIIYILRNILKNGRIKFSLIFFIILISAISYYIFKAGVGRRLLEHGLYDENSAAVRTNTLLVLTELNLEDFIMGIPKNLRIVYLYNYSGNANGISENFWIDFLFEYGIIFIFFWFFLYYRICYPFLKYYSKTNAFILTTAFAILASTNNSLSTTFVPLFVFIICCYLFVPKILYSIIDKKYLVALKYKSKNPKS